MMAIVAVACALLIEPPVRAEDPERLEALSNMAESKADHRGTRKLEPTTSAVRRLSQTSAKLPSAKPSSISHDRRWGTDLKWPEEWWSKTAELRSGGDKNIGPPEASKQQK